MTQTHILPDSPAKGRSQAALTGPVAQILFALCLLTGSLACAGFVAFDAGTRALFAFLLCAVLALLSFLIMARSLQRERRRFKMMFTTLSDVCQHMLAGESPQPVQLSETHLPAEAQLVVKVLNQVLDSSATARADARTLKNELAHLHQQMETLYQEMQPVMDGDLRTRNTISGGTPGKIAILCNALVEDAAQLVKWTQYMSDQIIQTSRGLIEHSLEIAQLTEAFAAQQETTANSIETLTVFTLQMESALFSNVEMLREHWIYLRESGWTSGTSSHAPDYARALTEPFQDMSRQMKLLENLLQKTHDTTILAENALKELQLVAQRFHRINGVVVQLTSITNNLTALAENWQKAAENYTLPTPTGARLRIVETSPLRAPS